MSRIIFCAKLKAESEALPNPVYPGALGERIFANISQAAWRMWLNHQTILINEYRLSLMDKSARVFLEQEMEKFLFGDHAELPENYQPLA